MTGAEMLRTIAATTAPPTLLLRNGHGLTLPFPISSCNSAILQFQGWMGSTCYKHQVRPLALLLSLALLQAPTVLPPTRDQVLSLFGSYFESLRVQAGIPGLAAAIVGDT